MNESKDKLLYILSKRKLTSEDKVWLSDYLEKNDLRQLAAILDQQYREDLAGHAAISSELSHAILSRVHHQIGKIPPIKSHFKLNRTHIFYIAASFVGIVLLLTYNITFKNESSLNSTKISKDVKTDDVAPAGNKGLLTLATGETIILDDEPNGTLLHMGNTTVVKKDGKLSYNVSSSRSDAITYNKVATPRGGRFTVALPDGSTAWLNAASSISFPSAFEGAERIVEISGEVYFEVAKNAAQPFKVKVDRGEVRVLGTHFNVMSYGDEPLLKTTLLEGSIEFTTPLSAFTLKPGQQIQQSRTGKVSIKSGIKAEDVIGWRDGMLHFENSDIQTIMRQLSRLYDVEVIYNKEENDRFYADLPSEANLSDILKVLKLTGKIDFQITGNKIIVNP